MKRVLFLFLFAATRALAQEAHPDLLAIQDNSFLLEEAYNQEAGVVQHIGVFTIDRDTDIWGFAFTQEWPVFSQKHQFSYTVPVLDGDLGDIGLHYRYQLIGNADETLAVTPRFTLLLPTSEDSETGVEAALAVSRVYAPRIVGHTNVAVTHQGETDLTLGQSVIYALNSRMHLMLEATYVDDELTINPGVRWAHNLRNGLQIVPGISAPITEGSTGLLFYVSFEK